MSGAAPQPGLRPVRARAPSSWRRLWSSLPKRSIQGSNLPSRRTGAWQHRAFPTTPYRPTVGKPPHAPRSTTIA
eukprot:877956-Prymnesium_polylepis.3